MASVSKVFSRHVAESMDSAPLVMAAGASLREALEAMTRQRRESVLVVSAGQAPPRLIGIFTERDVVARVALRAQGDEPLSALMTPDPYRVGGEDYLYHAIATMQRRDLRHLPVVDREKPARRAFAPARCLGGIGRRNGVPDPRSQPRQLARRSQRGEGGSVRSRGSALCRFDPDSRCPSDHLGCQPQHSRAPDRTTDGGHGRFVLGRLAGAFLF